MSRGRNADDIMHLSQNRTAAEQQAAALVMPIKTNVTAGASVDIRAWTVDRQTGLLTEDTYRLIPGQKLALFEAGRRAHDIGRANWVYTLAENHQILTTK